MDPELQVDTSQEALIPPPNDASVRMFDKIFGENWDSVFTGFGGAGFSPNVLFELLGAFNTVVLAATSVVVMYMLMVGTTGTAHEGTPLGKRYHSIYTPIRLATALAMMAPLPVLKISMLQAIMLLLAYYGFGGASTLTSVATTYMTENAGGLVSMPNPTSEMEDARRKILENFVFQEYQVRELGNSFSAGAAYAPPVWVKESEMLARANSGVKDVGTWVINFTVSDGMNLNVENGEAGSVSVRCYEGQNDPLCQARLNGMLAFINHLQPAASSIMSGHYVDTGHQYSTQATQAYVMQIAQAKQAQRQRVNEEMTQDLALVKQMIDQLGWMSLGAFHWIIADANDKASTLNRPGISVGSPDWGKAELSTDGTLMAYIERVGMYLDVKPTSREEIAAAANALSDADILARMGGSTHSLGNVIGENYGQASAVALAPLSFAVPSWSSIAETYKRTDSIVDTFQWAISTPGRAIIQMMVSLMTTGTDPIHAMANIGHSMIAVGEGLVAVGIVGNVSVEVAGGAKDGFDSSLVGMGANLVGVGVASEAAKQGLIAAAGWFVSLAIAAAIPLVIAGAGLAFYLPAVPFILYMLGVISVLILLVESIVAAPLWAAAVAMPEGEGFVGQHGKQGFMLMFGILLRPPLMVIGFFIAYLMMNAIGSVIGFGINIAFMSIIDGYVTGIVTILALLIIAGSFIIIVAHKIYGLITWLPDNAMRWMGQQIQNLGEGGETRQIGAVVAGHIGTAGNTARLATAPGGSNLTPSGSPNDGSPGKSSRAAAAAMDTGEKAAPATKIE